MRPITLILPYYINGGMLEEHQQSWAMLPLALRAHLHVIVIDDGSPSSPALSYARPVEGLGSYRLFRTKVDVRWNWLFCRNLGVSKATTDWVILTDIDHLLLEDTLRFLVESPDLDPACVYRLSRVDAPDLTPYKPHPNTWVMTREMFLDRVQGYDERFSGFYGSDSEFRERVHRSSRAVVMLEQAIVRYPREVIPDASTTTYGRKEPKDKTGVKRIRAERKQLGQWQPLRLTFPYEQLI